MSGEINVAGLAALAWIELREGEAAALQRDIEEIATLMDALQYADPGDGAAICGGAAADDGTGHGDGARRGHCSEGEGFARIDDLRPDVVRQSISLSTFLEQSPGPDKTGFTIPRLMDVQ